MNATVVFLQVPDLKSLNGPESVWVMAEVHRAVREATKGLKAERLSSLTGAIILLPDEAKADALGVVEKIAASLYVQKIAARIGVTTGPVTEMQDADGRPNFIGRSINQAARLAFSKTNGGLLVSELFRSRMAGNYPARHWLRTTQSIEAEGKRTERFPAVLRTHRFRKATSAMTARCSPETALMISYDLPKFSDGSARSLATRFRTLVSELQQLQKDWKEQVLFSPGGDGGVLVFASRDVRLSGAIANHLSTALQEASDHLSSENDIEARVALHYGQVFTYKNAAGVRRPVGPSLLDADGLAGDEPAKQAKRPVFSQSVHEFFPEPSGFEELLPARESVLSSAKSLIQNRRFVRARAASSSAKAPPREPPEDPAPGSFDPERLVSPRFVGREGLLKDLMSAVREGERNRRRAQLWWCWGFGGLGKSQFLRRAFLDGREGLPRTRFALIDWQSKEWCGFAAPPGSISQLLQPIAVWLKQLYGADLVAPFISIQEAVRAGSTRSDDFRRRFGVACSGVGPSSAATETLNRDVLALRSVLGTLRPGWLVSGSGDERPRQACFQDWLERVCPDAPPECRDPDNLLLQRLRDCLRRAAEQHPLVLMIDTHERLTEELDEALYQLTSPLLTPRHPFTLVVGSRFRPEVRNRALYGADERWRSLPDTRRRIVEFNREYHFNLAETRAALGEGGARVSNEVLQRLHGITAGVPLAVGMLGDLLRDSPGFLETLRSDAADKRETADEAINRITSEMAERVLLHATPDDRRDVAAMAVLRRASTIHLSLLWPNYRARLDDLDRRHSFIDGSDLHETVRVYLRGHLRARPPDWLASIVVRLLEVHQQVGFPEASARPADFVEPLLEVLNLQGFLDPRGAYRFLAPPLAILIAHADSPRRAIELALEIAPADVAGRAMRARLLQWSEWSHEHQFWKHTEIVEFLEREYRPDWPEAARRSLELVRALRFAAARQPAQAVECFTRGLQGRLDDYSHFQRPFLSATIELANQALANAAVAWSRRNRAGAPAQVWNNYLLGRHDEGIRKAGAVDPEFLALQCSIAAKALESERPEGDELAGRIDDFDSTSIRLLEAHMRLRHSGSAADPAAAFRAVDPSRVDEDSQLGREFLVWHSLDEQTPGRARKLAQVATASNETALEVARQLAEKELTPAYARVLIDVLNQILKRTDSLDADDLNSAAWSLYSARHRLEDAVVLARRSFEHSAELESLNTLAALLLRIGRWTEARPMLQRWLREVASERIVGAWKEFVWLFRDALASNQEEQFVQLLRQGGPRWALSAQALQSARTMEGLSGVARELAEQFRGNDRFPVCPSGAFVPGQALAN